MRFYEYFFVNSGLCRNFTMPRSYAPKVFQNIISAIGNIQLGNYFSITIHFTAGKKSGRLDTVSLPAIINNRKRTFFSITEIVNLP